MQRFAIDVKRKSGIFCVRGACLPQVKRKRGDVAPRVWVALACQCSEEFYFQGRLILKCL
jgi:hypothetical protein